MEKDDSVTYGVNLNADVYLVILHKLKVNYIEIIEEDIMHNYVTETILKLITLLQPYALQNLGQESDIEQIRSYAYALSKGEADAIINQNHKKLVDTIIQLTLKTRLYKYHKAMKSSYSELGDT